MSTETLWHGYDQAALDDQYRASGTRISNPGEYIERWRAESAALRAGGACEINVRFGRHPDEHFDVFTAGRADCPIHIFIHGGYWQSMSSKEFSFIAKGLTDAEIVTIILNYAICPDVTMTELVRQARAGVAFAHEHARRWGGDPDRLTLSGHSAGGHLTAICMSTDWPTFAPGRPADMVKAGLSISGLYDLEPVRLCYANDKLHMNREEALALSPCKHLAHARGDMTLAVGGRESEQFHWHQEHFGRVWGEATGAPPRVVDLPGHHHFSLLDELSQPEGILAREVRRMNGLLHA